MKLPGDNRWSLGTCVRALDNRSFEVEVCGRRYRRKRRHLRATKEMAPPPNAKDSQIEPSEPIKTDLTPSLPVVEHSTPTKISPLSSLFLQTARLTPFQVRTTCFMLIIAGLLSLGTLFSTELSFSGIISLPPFVIVHPFPPLKTD